MHRPIEDFVAAQGMPTAFNPYDYVGWLSAANDPPILLGVIDYAGATNDALDLGLDTSFSGTVLERLMPDGRAQVNVVLHTKDALAWVADLGDTFEFPEEFNCSDPSACDFIFGEMPLREGEDACLATGDSLLHVVFVNTALGAPLPDIFSAFVLGGASPGQELLSVRFSATAVGRVYDPTGVPIGAGRATIAQVGLFGTAGSGVALADGFPVEDVRVQSVGKLNQLPDCAN